MTDLEFFSISATSSALISRCSPYSSSPEITTSWPKPPAITLINERFIALHMMYERIAPEEPTRAPVTINRSFASMKPAAAAAQPE